MSDEERIARVARAMCVADGQDPEAESTVGVGEVEDGRSYRQVTAPAWTTYADEARRMVAAVMAMGLLE